MLFRIRLGDGVELLGDLSEALGDELAGVVAGFAALTRSGRNAWVTAMEDQTFRSNRDFASGREMSETGML